MSDFPGGDQLQAALEGAAAVHHEYEVESLGGRRDELWPGFYAAYVLGRLGDFAPCSRLSAVLADVDGEPWAEKAAAAIVAALDR